MDPSLEAFVTYDSSDRLLHFDGDENSAQLANKVFVIEYSLQNLNGEWATFKQTVIALPEDGQTQEGEVETCMVSFAEGTLTTIDYQIGSGPLSIDLPEIVQEPPGCLIDPPAV